MGILSGPEIKKQIALESIEIDPFIEENVGENALDLRLRDTLLYPTAEELSTRHKGGHYQSVKIPEEGYVLQPNKLYLGSTVETIYSNKFASQITGRSSIGRLGLAIHVTAGMIDVGFKGKITLEMVAVHPIRIFSNDRICQILFLEVIGELEQYQGRYLNDSGPMPSKGFEEEFGDFSGPRSQR